MATYSWVFYFILGYFCTVNGNQPADSGNSITSQRKNEPTADLNAAASSYYSGWNDPYANSGYGITGHGIQNKNENAYGAYDKYEGYNRHGPVSGHGYTGEYEGNSALNTGYPQNYLIKPPAENTAHAYFGNGGYGGYGGNGGLGSYLGYNNPYYNGANHLGYGYYKKPGHGGIYNSGITPSLVTGYRGYSRK